MCLGSTWLMILRIARMLGYTIPMSWTECIEWSRVAYDLFVRRLSFPLRTLLCLNRNGLWANHLSKTRAPLGTIQEYDYDKYTDFCCSMLLKRRRSVSDQLRFFIYSGGEFNPIIEPSTVSCASY